MLREWADIAQSASIILASAFAIYGFDSWRREFVGKRRIELAEEVLSLFYQAKDIIQAIRNPFGYVGEGETRKPSPHERAEDKQALDRAYVLIERYNKHIEVFSRIHTLRYRFMAQFGVEATKPFNDLNSVLNELILAAHSMARHHSTKDWEFLSEDQRKRRKDEIWKTEKVYWSGFEDDPIAPKVSLVIEEIEKSCKAIIQHRGSLFSWINHRLWGG